MDAFDLLTPSDSEADNRIFSERSTHSAHGNELPTSESVPAVSTQFWPPSLSQNDHVGHGEFVHGTKALGAEILVQVIVTYQRAAEGTQAQPAHSNCAGLPNALMGKSASAQHFDIHVSVDIPKV